MTQEMEKRIRDLKSLRRSKTVGPGANWRTGLMSEQVVGFLHKSGEMRRRREHKERRGLG